MKTETIIVSFVRLVYARPRACCLPPVSRMIFVDFYTAYLNTNANRWNDPDTFIKFLRDEDWLGSSFREFLNQF